MELGGLVRTSNCLAINSQKRHFSLSLLKSSSADFWSSIASKIRRKKLPVLFFFNFCYTTINGKHIPIAYFPSSLAKMQRAKKKTALQVKWKRVSCLLSVSQIVFKRKSAWQPVHNYAAQNASGCTTVLIF